MGKLNFILRGFINSVGVLIYTTIVAWLLFNGERFFGKASNFLMPLFLLLLFMVSATITGLLVLGRPIHLYLGGFKKEAIKLLFSTLAWLVLFAIITVIVILTL